MNRCKKLLFSGMAALSVLACSQSQGAGFAILEQTSAGLGRALGGISADTENAGAIFFNPALGVWHDRPVVTAGVSWLHVNAEMDLRRNNTADGNDGGNGGGWSYVPHFYYIHPISSDFAFGLGLSATSGTATHWNKYWAGRYNNIDTSISVIDLTPSFSYKVCDELSIGAGLMMEYCDAVMTRKLDLSSLGLGDQQLKFYGDSYQFGFTAGLMYQPIKGTRIGLGYRSTMRQNLDMEGRLRAGSKSIKGDAECGLNFPAMVNMGFQQDITDKWTVMAEITWTHSKRMKEMTVKFDTDDALSKALGGIKSDTTYMNWQDSWKFALGTEYKLTNKWTLRCGTAYDQTPVRSEEYRVASIPDLSRVWLSAGFSYAFTENISLDFGYVKLLFLRDKMEMQTPNGTLVSTNVHGDCDIISTALTMKF